MMDFILRSHANAMIRMEKWDERWEDEVRAPLREVTADIRALERTVRAHEKSNRAYEKSNRAHEKSHRAYERRMRALEVSDRRAPTRVKGIKDLMKLFSERTDIQSQRIDRIERSGR